MIFKALVTLRALHSQMSSFPLTRSSSIMSRMSSLVYSYTDEKYSDKGSSDKKDKALNSDIPDDGPALLLMNYDIVFVVGRPKSTSTKSSLRFRFNR